MDRDDKYAEYLESGAGNGEPRAHRARLDFVRSLLADTATWEEPPLGLGGSIDRALGRRPRWGRGAVAAAAAAVAAVAWAAASGGLLGIGEEEEPPLAVISLSGTELAGVAQGTASVRATDGGWSIYLDVEGLEPAPTGSYYQAWVGSNGEVVPVGSFHMREGAVPIGLWSGVDPHQYRVITVTLEQEGAIAPSGRVMMWGEATFFTDD